MWILLFFVCTVKGNDFDDGQLHFYKLPYHTNLRTFNSNKVHTRRQRLDIHLGLLLCNCTSKHCFANAVCDRVRIKRLIICFNIE